MGELEGPWGRERLGLTVLLLLGQRGLGAGGGRGGRGLLVPFHPETQALNLLTKKSVLYDLPPSVGNISLSMHFTKVAFTSSHILHLVTLFALHNTFTSVSVLLCGSEQLSPSSQNGVSVPNPQTASHWSCHSKGGLWLAGTIPRPGAALPLVGDGRQAGGFPPPGPYSLPASRGSRPQTTGSRPIKTT